MLVEDARRTLLRECEIGLVLDVGANSGQYATRLRSDGYSGKIISFEPLPDAYVELAAAAADDPLWETRELALGAEAGRAVLNVSENSYSSSFLPITPTAEAAAPEAAYVGAREVERTTLNSIDIPMHEPVLLKIDVQGVEPDVIRGGSRVLPRIAAVEAELSLVPLYEGQQLAHGVCMLLREFGFVPVALQSAFADPRSGEILQLDGLFRRDRSHPWVSGE